MGCNYQSIVGYVKVPGVDVLEKTKSRGGRTRDQVLDRDVCSTLQCCKFCLIVMEQVLIHILLIGKTMVGELVAPLIEGFIYQTIHLLDPPTPAHRRSI